MRNQLLAAIRSHVVKPVDAEVHPLSAERLSEGVMALGLGKTYRRKTALQDVSFTLPAGEMLAVVGPDGAGKTTLVQLLAGLLQPTTGTAVVAGLDVRTAGTALGARVGYMSEGFTLYGSLSVAENLAFFGELYGVTGSERDRRVAELLRFSQLDGALDRRASRLSGGMQKKLALACVLIHEPRVLLLDEPTLGVDPLSRQEFWRLLERFLAQDIAIVMTTAYLDEAERCQHAILLHEGHVLAAGAPVELREAYTDTLWEFAVAHADAARRLLGQRYGADRAYLARRHLRVAVPSDADSGPLDELKRAGIAVENARSVQPTLEDVFVGRIAATQAVASQPALANVNVSKARTAAAGGIHIDRLTRRFGEFTAVDSVSLDITPGEVFGLVGPNGSGKSTLIRMLIGVLPPTAGTAAVAGHDIHGSGIGLRRSVGYMSQRFSLYNDLSVEENIDFFGGVYSLDQDQLEGRKRWALALAGLEGQEHSRTGGLGGGYRQRLALVAALLHAPPVVFLDEPTSGVDPIARRRFWDLIYAVAQSGTTVLVTTHYLDEAERCDRIGLLSAGRLTALGSPGELKASALSRLGRLYAVETPSAVRALEVLTHQPDVLQATVYGASVRIGRRKGTVMASVESTLAAAGIPAHIRPAEPTLEDTFAALLRSEGQQP